MTEPSPAQAPRLDFALVHNWPGARNSEWELIGRIGRLLELHRHQVHVVDPMGTPLDEAADRVPRQPIPAGFDVVLNLHYLNPKFLDGISYVVNWNPLEFIVDDPNTGAPATTLHLPYLVDCLRTHERVLSGGSRRLDEYAAAARAEAAGLLPEVGSLDLYPSIEACEAQPLAVDAATFKVFYIGLNWERMSTDADRRIRHEGLFQLLDGSKRFEFYGLKTQFGVPLWSGIQSYRGELPFDGGRSIIDRSRACGVTLILSSRQHLASGLVSSRIFQAAAAGVVVISDRNSFIEQHFGDSVVYFDTGATAAETAASILDGVRWIETHWDAARTKAACCNAIFRQKFALDVQVDRLCAQAVRDVAAAKAHCQELQRHRVRIIHRVSAGSYGEYHRFLQNVERQDHRNVELVVYADHADVTELSSINAATGLTGKIRLEVGSMTLGEAVLKASGCDYTLVYSPGFEWTRAHLSGLLTSARARPGTGIQPGIVYTPLFVDCRPLRSGADTTQFFTMGMPGGFRPIGLRNVARFELDQFPSGNMLICREVTDARDESGRGALARFDTGCVYMLLYMHYQETGQLPRLVPAITSRLVRHDIQTRYRYDAYAGATIETPPGAPESGSRQRDRNAFLALGRYLDHRAITDFSERAATWEYERYHQPEIYKHSAADGRMSAVSGSAEPHGESATRGRTRTPREYARAIYRRARKWLTGRP